jgi:hypothetical protein
MSLRKNISTKEKMPAEENKASKRDQKSEAWTPQERENFKSLYGCEILKQNCTWEESKDTNVPNDAYIVTYMHDGKVCYDLTRSSKRSNIFDMYYDNLGPVLRRIDWGYGRINPKLWGYKTSEKKKRK